MTTTTCSRLFFSSPARCALTVGLVLSAAGQARAQVAPAQPAQPAPADAAQPAPTPPPQTVAESDPIAMKIADTIRREMGQAPKFIEANGYLRAGTGINSKGGNQSTFNAPGAYAKYRLGNEDESYVEYGLKFNWVNPDHDDGAWFSTTIKPSLKAFRLQSYDTVAEFAMREAFVEGGHVIESKPEMSFWAGERFYRRKDIHINDFFFNDTSGWGAGFQDLKVADTAKLHVAWLISSNGDAAVDHGKQTKNSFDLRLSDIMIGKSSLELWVMPVLAAAGDAGVSATGNRHGIAGGVFLNTPFMGGFNEISAQFGAGGGANLTSRLDNTPKGAWMLRVVERAAVQVDPKLSMMWTGVLQFDNTNGSDGDVNPSSGNMWISAGVRPVYMFGKHIGGAVEAGVDIVKPEVPAGAEAKTGVLGKLTVAGVIRPGASFWDRPELRLFVTAATWNENIKGNVGGPAYAADTFGLTAGVQAEMWW